jgi:hypothetical protein
MWTNVLRDETLVDALPSALTVFWAYLDGGDRRARRRLGRVAHAATFRSPPPATPSISTPGARTRDGGVSRKAVVELASAMITRAARR